MTSLPPTDDSRRGGSEATHFVLGGTHIGTAIGDQLRKDGHAVAIIDEAYDSDEVPGIRGNPTDVDLLTQSGLESAASVVVGGGSDARNFLIAQLVRAHFDVPQVTVLVHDPDRFSAVAQAGHEPLCVTTVLSAAVAERI